MGKAPLRTEHGQREVERMFDFDLAPIAKRNQLDIAPRDAARFLTIASRYVAVPT